MTEITKEQMQRLHRSGASLSKSWLVFAHPDLKAQWEDLHKQSGMDLIKQDATAATKIDGDVSAKFAHAFSGFSKLASARSELETTLKANVLSYISQGYVFGFGYELPRSVSSDPVAIPKAAWSGKCDWEKGTLSFRGLEFVDVRLTTNRIRNEILERSYVDSTPPRAVGRPSIVKDIQAAIHALDEAGEIDTKASQKSHFPKAQRWLELNRPNLNPISYETFRKNFSPYFNDLKKNKKQ